MHKNELELRRLGIEAQKFGDIMNFVLRICTLLTFLGALYLIMAGLNEMVKSQPEALNSLAIVIEKFQFNAIFGYILAAGTTAAWFYEREGKKRAIKKSDGFRTELEKNDSYKSSSNLDEHGHTPKRGG